jgi:proline-specific peptidase
LALEKTGLYGKRKDYEKSRYPEAYMKAAWGEGYFPYLYQNHPDPNYDPLEDGKISWDVYRAMWGSHGEFIIDGNLKSVEYTDRLGILHVPTLIVVGDHDECDPTLSREMNTLIPGSKLTVLPKSGHLTFVDQNEMFLRAVGDFVK